MATLHDLRSRNTRTKHAGFPSNAFILQAPAVNPPPLLRLQATQYPDTQEKHITNPATMSSGEVLKADKDFSKEVDAAIPEAEKLASVCLMAAWVWRHS